MTRQLIESARHYWARIDGESPHLDLLDLPMDRFLNHVYYWLIKDAPNEEAVARVDARLWMPPKGVEAKTGPWSVEAETQAFKMFSAQVGQDAKAP